MALKMELTAVWSTKSELKRKAYHSAAKEALIVECRAETERSSLAPLLSYLTKIFTSWIHCYPCRSLTLNCSSYDFDSPCFRWFSILSHLEQIMKESFPRIACFSIFSGSLSFQIGTLYYWKEIDWSYLNMRETGKCCLWH